MQVHGWRAGRQENVRAQAVEPVHLLRWVRFLDLGYRVYHLSARPHICRFTDGVLAGKKMCVRKLWNLCTSYDGPPFNIYNPEECPPAFKGLAEAMLQDRLHLISLYKKVTTASERRPRRNAALGSRV